MRVYSNITRGCGVKCPKCGAEIQATQPDKPWFDVWLCDECGYSVTEKDKVKQNGIY